MSHQFSNTELEAYLDEDLPDARMAEIEAELRDDPAMIDRLKEVVGRLDAGVHSLASTWRRHRLSCASREQLGSYLLEVLDAEQTDYLRFHLERIGCRYCNASLDDLRQQHAAADKSAAESRRSKYFQSSAGYLSKDE